MSLWPKTGLTVRLWPSWGNGLKKWAGTHYTPHHRLSSWILLKWHRPTNPHAHLAHLQVSYFFKWKRFAFSKYLDVITSRSGSCGSMTSSGPSGGRDLTDTVEERSWTLMHHTNTWVLQTSWVCTFPLISAVHSLYNNIKQSFINKHQLEKKITIQVLKSIQTFTLQDFSLCFKGLLKVDYLWGR